MNKQKKFKMRKIQVDNLFKSIQLFFIAQQIKLLIKSTISNNLMICNVHKNTIEYIVLLKDWNQKRLFCNQCLINESKLDFNDYIPLHQFLENPCVIIDRITKENYSKYLKAVQTVCNRNFDTIIHEVISKLEFLQEIYKTIKEQLLVKLKECKETQQSLNQLQEEFYDKIQYNTVIDLIHLIKNFDEQQNLKIEETLSEKLDNMTKDSTSIKTQINLMQEKHKELYMKLSKPINDQYKQYLSDLLKRNDEVILNLNEDLRCRIIMIEPLIQHIQSFSNKQVKNKKQIYLGSRDGLNSNSFWNKIDCKSNLLMIFKSQSTEVFGCYSPCQWQKNLKNYVQDDSLTSFLFSLTKNQIYPLNEKQKQYAIYCRQDQGPILGNGHDMWIGPDFKSGGSCLGSSYQLDSQYQNQRSQHLFGEFQPQIIECEVYQLLFQ